MSVSTHLMVPGRPASDSWIEANLDGKTMGDCYFNAKGHKYRLVQLTYQTDLDGTAVAANDVLVWIDIDEFEVTDDTAKGVDSTNPMPAGVCEGAFTAGATDAAAANVCILVVIDGPTTVATGATDDIVEGDMLMAHTVDSTCIQYDVPAADALTTVDTTLRLKTWLGWATAADDDTADTVTAWVRPIF